MAEHIDASILQRIRLTLARRRTSAAPREISLLSVPADALARHAQALFESGEAEGWVVERDGVAIALARGGLTPRGWRAMHDRSAQEAAARAAWTARLRMALKGAGVRLLDLGWKLAAGVALAAVLAIVGLS